MRWPLRLQIMLPMAATMLLAVVVVGGGGAILAVRGAKARIESQIAEVARILKESNFPLTDAVLKQMDALSGAALVLVDESGRALAMSREKAILPITMGGGNGSSGRDYFHTTVELSSRLGNPNRGTLHILYPKEEYRRAWQRAVVPSLGFVIVAMPAVMLLAAVTAARIAQRVSRLHLQVDQIAHGDFQQIEVSQRDDEIRALGEAVNHMAAMLARYETEIRRTERMRTLVHLGGGIAHQLRNSATGCGIALDLHAQECPDSDNSESLDVAKRQLRLMEEYLQRFLQLGKPNRAPADESVNLIALVEDLLPLVEPAAKHAGVELSWFPRASEACLPGNPDRLRQLVINLLLNAIEAAAQGRAQNNLPAEVVVELADRPPDRLVLSVADSGPGPAEAVRGELFEPFVTEKPDGVGLGLSVARDVAIEHGGRIDWRRVGERTVFVVELPKESRVESEESRANVRMLALDS